MSRTIIGIEYEGSHSLETFRSHELAKFIETIKGVKKVVILDQGLSESFIKNMIRDLQDFLKTKDNAFRKETDE